MPSPSPSFDLDAWRAHVTTTVDAVYDFMGVGIFALVLFLGLAVVLLTALVVVGVRGRG